MGSALHYVLCPVVTCLYFGRGKGEVVEREVMAFVFLVLVKFTATFKRARASGLTRATHRTLRRGRCVGTHCGCLRTCRNCTGRGR